MQSQDLISLRTALRQLEGVIASQDRRHEVRYTPNGPLSKAKVLFALDPLTSLDADVVDLSPHGMRLAVEPGVACESGSYCTIEISLTPAQTLHLDAEVRWVKHHPFITVFGVRLLDGEELDTEETSS